MCNISSFDGHVKKNRSEIASYVYFFLPKFVQQQSEEIPEHHAGAHGCRMARLLHHTSCPSTLIFYLRASQEMH
jgi:hypothetical protein